MLVKIEEIRDAGLDVTERLSLEQLTDALEGSGFKPAAGVEAPVNLRRVSGGVLLHARFTARVEAPCKRCLADSTLELPTSFTLNLVPKSLARGEDVLDEKEIEEKERVQGETGGSFSIDDADEEVFDGKVIDLTPIVREQVLLALPMNALCREDCRGLCGQCGQNLNEKACGCNPKFVDPRFAALKNIKLQG